MRARLEPTALLVCVLACAQATAQPAPEGQALIESPAGQVQCCCIDLASRVAPEDAPYVMYLSIFTVQAAERPSFRRKFRGILNHWSGSRSLVQEFDVPESKGTLFRIDIRQALCWTRVGWYVVANRDYLFREPLLPHRETQFARLVTGREQDPKTLAAGFVVNAYQLFRDGIESNRSSTYYDLLYASERHPDPDGGKIEFATLPREPIKPVAKPWEGGVWPPDGKQYPAGSFTYVHLEDQDEYDKKLAAFKAGITKADVLPKRPISIKDAGKGIANFPDKGVDFERRWGAEIDAKTIKTLLIDPRIGGIAAGTDGDAKNGSYVALNDRAIRIIPTIFGWSARTFDVFENSGEKDHLERFREIALGDAKADAGEILASLPNGAQAALLVNGEDKRVEIANSAAAQIRSDKIDPRYRDVRTHMGCIGCHAPNGGFIAFTEQYKDSIEKGIKSKILDGYEAARIRDFYFSWEKSIKRWRDPYENFIESATRTEKDKPWTGAQFWEQVKRSRDGYDSPVTIETVAFEFGMPVETMRLKILGKTEKDSPIDIRLNNLAIGKSMPRRTYEVDVAFKLNLWLDVHKDKEEPIKTLLAPALIDDAIRKFGYSRNVDLK